MSAKTSTVGGGPATGLAGDWVSLLRGALQTGTFGGQPGSGARFDQANPLSSTTGIAGFLNDILSGGAGNIGGSINEMISRDTERQAADLRARFGAAGGTAFGTPAAYAEGVLRSEQAPKLATAVGGLQLQTILPLLQMITGLSGQGIPQAQTLVQPNPWLSGLSALTQGASGFLPFLHNPFNFNMNLPPLLGPGQPVNTPERI